MLANVYLSGLPLTAVMRDPRIENCSAAKNAIYSFMEQF